MSTKRHRLTSARNPLISRNAINCINRQAASPAPLFPVIARPRDSRRGIINGNEATSSASPRNSAPPIRMAAGASVSRRTAMASNSARSFSGKKCLESFGDRLSFMESIVLKLPACLQALAPTRETGYPEGLASAPGLKPQALCRCRFAAFIGRNDDRSQFHEKTAKIRVVRG